MEIILKKLSWILQSIFILTLMIGVLGCERSTSNETQLIPKLLAPKIGTPSVSIPMSRPVNPVNDETRETYQWYCAQCHGIKGKGDGINAKYVTVLPRNHTKANYLETRSDKELFDSIRLGGLKVGRAPCMPAWGHTFDEETVWSLVRYIRELCQCEEL
tara:strand:+ start:4899 stop:5375 length:477 start_codon:yes stop_codon:yes gene_type:complete